MKKNSFIHLDLPPSPLPSSLTVKYHTPMRTPPPLLASTIIKNENDQKYVALFKEMDRLREELTVKEELIKSQEFLKTRDSSKSEAQYEKILKYSKDGDKLREEIKLKDELLRNKEEIIRSLEVKKQRENEEILLKILEVEKLKEELTRKEEEEGEKIAQILSQNQKLNQLVLVYQEKHMNNEDLIKQMEVRMELVVENNKILEEKIVTEEAKNKKNAENLRKSCETENFREKFEMAKLDLLRVGEIERRCELLEKENNNLLLKLSEDNFEESYKRFKVYEEKIRDLQNTIKNLNEGLEVKNIEILELKERLFKNERNFDENRKNDKNEQETKINGLTLEIQRLNEILKGKLRVLEEWNGRYEKVEEDLRVRNEKKVNENENLHNLLMKIRELERNLEDVKNKNALLKEDNVSLNKMLKKRDDGISFHNTNSTYSNFKNKKEVFEMNQTVDDSNTYHKNLINNTDRSQFSFETTKRKTFGGNVSDLGGEIEGLRKRLERIEKKEYY